MKSRFISRLSSVLLASLLFISVGCDKDNNDDDDDDAMYTLSGTASGSQEVPAVATNGTGALSGSYNKNTNALVYNVTWSNLSATASAAHFHGPANVGETANPVITFVLNNNGTSGSANATVTLTETQENDLLAGKWYYNIHTPTYPNGEIRAQVVAANQ